MGIKAMVAQESMQRDNEKFSKSKDDAAAKMNKDFKTNATNKSEVKVNQLAQARRIISARQIQQLAIS